MPENNFKFKKRSSITLNNSSNKKIISLSILILFSIILSLQTFAAKDFIVENKTSALFIINGTTGNIILAPSFGMVGIGTINPINALTVIGSVSTFGSLNATFINATEIRIGNSLVPINGAFNNGNYTALEDSAFRIVNFTTQLNNYIPSFFNNENFTNLKPFTLTNYSTEYALSGFKIINFTNEYAGSGFKIANYTALENAAFTNANYSNLNTTQWNLSRNLILYPKDATYLVRIGDVNRNISNDTFAVIGSAAVYGSLNATSFNSSFILQNNNQVQTVNAVFNNVNYTSLENAAFTNTNYTNLEAAAFTKANYSAEYASSGFKNANYTTLEDAAFRIANYTSLENAAFTNANYSNLNTTQWNASGNNIYQKNFAGSIGIGLTAPSALLHVQTGQLSTSDELYVDTLNNNSLAVIRVGSQLAATNRLLYLAVYGQNATGTGNLGQQAGNSSEIWSGADVTNGLHVGTTANAPFALYSNSAERMRITGAGNVGIGTTTPQNKLEVIGAVTLAGGVNASSLNVTGFSITDDSLVTLSDGSKKKIKDIEKGEKVLTLDEKTGKLVPRKVNALLDHGIRPIYEMATEDGRAINTTAEHPYLAKLYDKELCDKYAGNVWNKEPDEFSEYCTRWVETGNLRRGMEIAVPQIEEKQINQISSFSILPISSAVVYNLTSDCCLRCGSFDQIAALIDNASATYGESFGSSGKDSIALSSCESYSNDLTNLMNLSISCSRISNSCSESLDLDRQSSLYLSNSDFMKSGAKKSALSNENRYAAADFGFIIENNTLLSSTNLIFYSSTSRLFSGVSLESNSSLLSGESSDSNLLNEPFFAFLPSSTDHLVNSCSSLDSSCFSSFLRNASLLTFSDKNPLVTSDQFISGSDSISFFKSSETDNVMFGIFAPQILNFVYSVNNVKQLYKTFGSDITFDEIASIKALEPQHVYDLAIEGTRNFIANDIVAHNTYLSTASGSTGIGLTNPNYLLQTASGTDGRSVNLSNVLYVNGSSGNVGIGTAAPAAILDVNSSANTARSYPLYISNRGTEGSGVGAGIVFNTLTVRRAIIETEAAESNQGSDLKFYTHTTDSGDTIDTHITEKMRIKAGGNVGINDTTPSYTLDVNGNVQIQGPGGNTCADSGGTATCNNFVDYAELYPSSELVESGDVVIIDFENPGKVKKSAKAYDYSLAGVVSTKPAVLIEGSAMIFMNNGFILNQTKPAVALAGRVPTKVTDENGMIKAGDLITTSNKKGYAMKCKKPIDCIGAIAGISLENQDEKEDKIMVMVK